MQEQVIPEEGSQIRRPNSPEAVDLKKSDPALHRSFEDVVGALREDMLPTDHQHRLFSAMSPGVQREVVARVSGLDASILLTFKKQLELIDGILRRTFDEDGSVKGDEEDLGLAPKDALNMSLRVNQMMIRELPKIYNMDRIKRTEEAILSVMSKHMSRDQQNELLQALDAAQAGIDS